MTTSIDGSEATVPDVSILMPVYNAQRYLDEAIESTLAQIGTNFELIVVDDGSTDRSLEIIERYAEQDKRVVVVSRPNTGLIGALNDGLKHCRAKLIARMDADDVMMPNRLEVQTTFMDEHPEIVACGAHTLRVDACGLPITIFKVPLSHEQIEQQLFEGHGSVLSHPTLMVRGDVLRQLDGYRVQPRYNEKVGDLSEDLDLYLRLCEYGQLANLPDVLLKYRQHMSSICHAHFEFQNKRNSEVANIYRAKRSLPLLDTNESIVPLARWWVYQRWASQAAVSGYWRTARKYALGAMMRQPWSKQVWRTFLYCFLPDRARGMLRRVGLW